MPNSQRGPWAAVLISESTPPISRDVLDKISAKIKKAAYKEDYESIILHLRTLEELTKINMVNSIFELLDTHKLTLN